MKPRLKFSHLALIVFATPAVALAALGGTETSVQVDQFQMKATHRVAAMTAKYTVHEIQIPTGTLVKEYLSPNGTVFAVTWRGPVAPDLLQIMGQHFDAYANSLKARFEGLTRST